MRNIFRRKSNTIFGRNPFRIYPNKQEQTILKNWNDINNYRLRQSLAQRIPAMKRQINKIPSNPWN